MSLKLPRLKSNFSIVNGENGRALPLFERLWDTFATAIENSVSAIGLTGIVVSDGTTSIARSIVGGAGITVSDGDGQAGNPSIAITNTVVTPASYGDSTHVPAFMVNARGQLTAAAAVAIAFPAAPVTSVAGKTGTVTLAKGDVGLGNVSNKAQLPLDGTDAMTAPITLKSYAVASLPAVGAAQIAYASNGRKNGEGAGSGTGVLVFCDATAWRACDTGATVAA